MKEYEQFPLEKLVGKERKPIVIKRMKKVLETGSSKEVAIETLKCLFCDLNE
jgi:hypothetical protein